MVRKTGLYLDQLDAHREIAKLAKGKRVLDCFCNQGGFALACAKAGAASVTAVDSSGPAIEAAQRNAELNGVEINTVQHNAFDFLKHCEDEYDLVILDPPSFTKNKKSLNNAMRGYKEIHLRGIKLSTVMASSRLTVVRTMRHGRCFWIILLPLQWTRREH